MARRIMAAKGTVPGRAPASSSRRGGHARTASPMPQSQYIAPGVPQHHSPSQLGSAQPMHPPPAPHGYLPTHARQQGQQQLPQMQVLQVQPAQVQPAGKLVYVPAGVQQAQHAAAPAYTHAVPEQQLMQAPALPGLRHSGIMRPMRMQQHGQWDTGMPAMPEVRVSHRLPASSSYQGAAAAAAAAAGPGHQVLMLQQQQQQQQQQAWQQDLSRLPRYKPAASAPAGQRGSVDPAGISTVQSTMLRVLDPGQGPVSSEPMWYTSVLPVLPIGQAPEVQWYTMAGPATSAAQQVVPGAGGQWYSAQGAVASAGPAAGGMLLAEQLPDGTLVLLGQQQGMGGWQ